MLRGLLVPIVMCLLAQPVDGQDQRSVSTNGEAVIYVTPDEVIVHVGVETFARELAASKAQNDTLAQKLVAAIRELGVEQRHIQTANIEVEIQYRSNSPSLAIEGFVARRAYAVTLKDVKKFEALVDVSIGNGANRLMGFEYRTTELRKHRDEARRMAIRAAREKAELLAGELGVSISQPRNISEGGMSYFGFSSSRWGMTNAFMSQNSSQTAEPVGEGGETMPMGQIGIRASVHVIFDLGV